jgi:hypothetical protein
MAHAFHDRILGRDYPAVKIAYRQAMDRKLYDIVDTRIFVDLGQFQIERHPAYARTNHWEYFAELSGAYLNLQTQYYPFTRSELAEHDAGGYALMEAVWRPVRAKVVNDFPFAVSVDRFTVTQRRFHLCELMPGKGTEFDAFEGISLVAVNKLDGSAFRINSPDKDGRTWRLSRETTDLFIDIRTIFAKPSR